MRRFAALATLCFAPAAFGYTADELATKNVAAKGGLESIHAIKSLRLSGSLRVQQDTLELGLVTLVKQPGSVRYEATLQGLTQVQAFDGNQAWQINPFQGRKDPEKLSADDAKGLGEDAADFVGPLVDYQAKGYKLDYLGREDIDGTDAYKLRVTRKNGDLTTVYLDPDYFLEIRTVNRRIEHGVPVETVVDYGDYEKVAGVFLAFSQESGVKGSGDRQKVQFDKGEANVDATDGLFHFPAGKTAAPAGK
jgi:hypothetical protein